MGDSQLQWGQERPQREDVENYCFPWSGVLYNVSTHSTTHGLKVGPTVPEILRFFQAFNPESAQILRRSRSGHHAKCVLQFKGDMEGLLDAQAFEQWFNDTNHGLRDYQTNEGDSERQQGLEDGWYGWIAREDDYEGRGGEGDVVGKYLQATAELKDLQTVNKELRNVSFNSEEADRMVEERVEEEKKKLTQVWTRLMKKRKDANSLMKRVVKELKLQVKEAEIQLKETENEIANQSMTINVVVTKSRGDTDELEQARNLGLKAIEDYGSADYLHVKKMGEIFQEPWKIACQKKYRCGLADDDDDTGGDVDWEVHCSQLLSEWEERLRDPSYYPFKTVSTDDNNDTWKLEVDRDDPHLCSLRASLGAEVCDTVIVALRDILTYNGSGRYPVPVVFNHRSGRRATLREVIAQLVELIENPKCRKRGRPAGPSASPGPAATDVTGASTVATADVTGVAANAGWSRSSKCRI